MGPAGFFFYLNVFFLVLADSFVAVLLKRRLAPVGKTKWGNKEGRLGQKGQLVGKKGKIREKEEKKMGKKKRGRFVQDGGLSPSPPPPS